MASGIRMSRTRIMRREVGGWHNYHGYPVGAQQRVPPASLFTAHDGRVCWQGSGGRRSSAKPTGPVAVLFGLVLVRTSVRARLPPLLRAPYDLLDICAVGVFI